MIKELKHSSLNMINKSELSITVVATICFAALSAFCVLAVLAFVLPVMALSYAWGNGAGTTQENEVPSPDKTVTAVITNIDAGRVSSDTVIIDIKSNIDADHQNVGYFVGVGDLNVKWTEKNILCVEYQRANQAKFKTRFIYLNKETITVNVMPGIKEAKR